MFQIVFKLNHDLMMMMENKIESLKSNEIYNDYINSIIGTPIISLEGQDVFSSYILSDYILLIALRFSEAIKYLSGKNNGDFEIFIFDEPLFYLLERSELINRNQANKYEFGVPKHGDTVYLTTADENGMMVSYIQSNYMGFGSGIVIPRTGISLQNRGNGFNLIENHPNQVSPNKRPFHTIIPAFVTKKGKPLMSFGVMGGEMQPQGHTQMIIRIFDYNQNPQAALDAPRWRVMQGLKVNLEDGFKKEIYDELPKLGHQINKDHYFNFGGGQIIYQLEEGYLGASDPRKDGQAIGY